MIAVLGATGGVGRAAVGALREQGRALRLGGRDLAALAELAGPHDEVVPVDVTRPAELRAFCAGAEVVLAAAGPSHHLGERMLDAAYRAGAAYVDPAGDEPLHAIARTRPPGQAVILSAGALPGLSGLLLRRAVAVLGRAPARLEMYCGGRYPFTPAAAADVAAAAGDRRRGIAGGSRRGGVTVPGGRAQEVALPTVGHPVTALPYLSGELLRFAEDHTIADVDGFTVVDGEATAAAVAAPVPSARRISDAAALECAGREPYLLLMVRVSDAHRTVTAVARGVDAGALTGAVAAHAAVAVPAGVHYAADVLDPVGVLDGLRARGELTVLSLTECGSAVPELVEEGSL